MPDSEHPLKHAEDPSRDPTEGEVPMSGGREPSPVSGNSVAASDDDGAAWAPLRLPIFRAFWIASLISNLGTWIHEVGAGWLMTSLDPDPQMVSAVKFDA